MDDRALAVEQLNSPDATEADVLHFLRLRLEEFQDQSYPHVEPEVYFRPGDLARYRDAERWWPKDAPPRHVMPNLVMLCRNVVSTIPGTGATTFMAELEAHWRRCCTWLQSEGRDLTHPNETPEERRRRQNRERQNRYRQNKAEPDGARAEVTRLYKAWVAACGARKAAHAAVDAEHDPLVDTARAAWDAARCALPG